jgi:hypothetical protein
LTNFSTTSLTTMKSTVTLIKSPTFPFSTEQRERLIDLIAERYLENMDVRDLERFFLDVQTEYLTNYDDGELLSEVEDVTADYEYEEIINELG